MSPTPHLKYPFIDTLRGYAVLLVITCHVGGMFPELPYPVKKLTSFGWHGVQLFFLMSCVTLLLSWRSDEAKGRASVKSFWIRRFFRIAPLYYLAAAFYFAIEPPASGFDLVQLLTSFTFVNAWHPILIPTTADRWMVVPGGWSIGVEFTFYALFPLIAAFVRSMRSAWAFCAGASLFGCAANILGYHFLAGQYGEAATENFLYFWFPNQLTVFGLGTVLFYWLRQMWAEPEGRVTTVFRKHADYIVLLCAALVIVAVNCPFPERLPFSLPLVVPALFVASLIFMILACALGNAPESIFNNRLVRAFGTASFSAYILHFAVLHKLPVLLPTIFDVQRVTGWRAILTMAELWAVVVPLTFALSLLTYRLIEEPMIAVGRRLLTPRRDNAEARRISGLAQTGNLDA